MPPSMLCHSKTGTMPKPCLRLAPEVEGWRSRLNFHSPLTLQPCFLQNVQAKGEAHKPLVHNDTIGNMVNITGQKTTCAQFTCRNHAVSMGGGWQAVTGRGVVHEDWQGWISCKWGERVGTECLACHPSLASFGCSQWYAEIWRDPLTGFFFFASSSLALFGLVSHCCFPWAVVSFLVLLKSFFLAFLSCVLLCLVLLCLAFCLRLVYRGLLLFCLDFFLAASCLLSPLVLSSFLVLFSLAQSSTVLS